MQISIAGEKCNLFVALFYGQILNQPQPRMGVEQAFEAGLGKVRRGFDENENHGLTSRLHNSPPSFDQLMDMARTSVNVLGNCLATVVISRWEGDFGKEQPSAVVMNALAG